MGSIGTLSLTDPGLCREAANVRRVPKVRYAEVPPKNVTF
jgi:hypothetical protein